MSFYARAEAGDILARFSTDLAAVENAVVLALPAATSCILGILSSATNLCILQWRLGLLTVLGLPICLVGPRLLTPRATAAGYELKTRQGAVTGAVQESVSAQAVIKSFGLQPIILSRFRVQLAELYRLGVRANTLSYILERTPALGVLLLNVVLAGAGAYLVFVDKLTLGSLVSFQGLTLLLSSSVEGLTSLIPLFVQATAGMQRIEEVLEERSQVTDIAGAAVLPPFSRGITFDRVSFGYTPGSLSLHSSVRAARARARSSGSCCASMIPPRAGSPWTATTSGA
jgi:ATP-binding cassette subfamily B protein